MKYAFTLLIAILATCFAFSQTTLKGKIQTKGGEPLVGATITVINKQTGALKHTSSDSDGNFEITAKAGDKITIHFVGYETFETDLNQEDITKGLFISFDEKELNTETVAALGGGSISPKSYWIGAKLGYNFDGFADDDVDNYFVGAAKVILNQSSRDFLKGDWGVVGNVAGFISNQDKKEASKNKEKLALSVQGLGVGLYQLWEQEVGSKNAIREYLTAGYRLNTFKKVGKDSITVNLSQLKLSGGFEFEAATFKKGGAMNVAIEITHLRFDPNRYELVIGEKKKSLTSVELGAILPVNSNLGFFASGTFAPSMKPVYLFGIMVRTDAR